MDFKEHVDSKSVQVVLFDSWYNFCPEDDVEDTKPNLATESKSNSSGDKCCCEVRTLMMTGCKSASGGKCPSIKGGRK